jgi:hypothetical protein
MTPSPVRPFLGVLAGLLAVCCGALPLLAHDVWLLPSDFTPEAGARVDLALYVGHPREGFEPVGRNPLLLERFFAVGPDGERSVPGQDGAHPAGVLRPDLPGRWVIGYRGGDRRQELSADRFEGYLREKGLEAVSVLRARRGEGDRPGRELYSRALKSLLRVGPAGATGPPDLFLGFRLELVAEADPFRLAPGSLLLVTLRFEGAPLPGALVEAHSLIRPALHASARTDGAGRAELPVAAAGPWVVTAVHMVPTAGGDADWQSVWAALTLSIEGP